MTAHVFVVSKETFPIHLKYMFAGTGAGDDGHENLGMISDVASCRVDDKILFFVTGIGFFGSFKVKGVYFLDDDGRKYMSVKDKKGKNKLTKKLTNRIFIEPDEVYPYGITEWELLDNIAGLEKGKEGKIQDFLWSLLYRKLDGNRGCTPIFDYEYDFILKRIKAFNQNQILISDGYSFSEDSIKSGDHVPYDLNGIEYGVRLKDYIDGKKYYSIEEKINKAKTDGVKWKTKKGKDRTQRKCESELELFFSAYGKLENKQGEEIAKVLGNEIVYFGTQVVCSFGAKRIDILAIDKNDIIKVIELKDTEYYDGIIDDQLNYYISWVDQYIKEPIQKTIQPIIIIKKSVDVDLVKINKMIQKIKEKNNISSKVLPIKVFFWTIENGNIVFKP